MRFIPEARRSFCARLIKGYFPRLPQLPGANYEPTEATWGQLRLGSGGVHDGRGTFCALKPPPNNTYASALVTLQTRVKAVMENFCRLHEDGVLYRANRLVNWCVRMNTTLSNLEVRRGPFAPHSRLRMVFLIRILTMHVRCRRSNRSS